jgi:glutathione S-transferase
MLLYSGPLSLFARKVEIALGIKQLAYERVMVPFTQTAGYAPKNPEVLRINPKGQVPVLIDRALELYDSTAILEYLDEAYPTVRLYPQDASARAKVRLAELEADEVLLVPLRKLMFRTEPPGIDAARQLQQEDVARVATTELAAMFAKLDQELSDAEFLCGAFSVADIATFMIVHYSLRLGGPSVAGFKNVRTWYKLLAAKHAFAAVIEEISVADQALSYPVAGAFSGLD